MADGGWCEVPPADHDGRGRQNVNRLCQSRKTIYATAKIAKCHSVPVSATPALDGHADPATPRPVRRLSDVGLSWLWDEA